MFNYLINKTSNTLLLAWFFVSCSLCLAESHSVQETKKVQQHTEQRALLPFDINLGKCNFLKRDRGHHFLQESWHWHQTGLDFLSAHPLVQKANYSDNRLAIIDSGLSAKGNPDAGQQLEDLSIIDVSDQFSHGTHVSGIAASKRFGVNPRLQIIPKAISVTSTIDEFHTSVINRLREISKDPSIRVVNLSLASFEQPGVKEAVLELVKKGVWVVYAAGNSGQVNDDSARLLRELSNIPELFAVGALSYTGVPASFSNVGPNVRLFAPGAAIESLNHAYDPKEGNARTSILQSGTSMAAPYLAAILTTLRAIQPDFDPRVALLLLKETSIRRGTSRTIDQVNPVLAVEYLNAIRNAQARGDCRSFESCLPSAKKEIEGQLKAVRRNMVPPTKGGCQEWKNLYDTARKGYFLSRGEDPLFSEMLQRMALSLPQKDGIDVLYYETRGNHSARLSEYSARHRTLLADDELKAASDFHQEPPQAPGLLEDRRTELEASLANVEQIWRECHRYLFEGAKEPRCSRALWAAPINLRIELARRILKSGKALSSPHILNQLQFYRDDDREGSGWHEKLLPQALDGIISRHNENEFQKFFEELPLLSEVNRKRYETALRKLKDADPRLLARIGAYTNRNLTENELKEMTRELSRAGSMPMLPTEAALDIQSHRVRAGYFSEREMRSAITDLFSSAKSLDDHYLKDEESSPNSGRYRLTLLLAELAKHKGTAKLIGDFFSKEDNLNASNLFVPKQNTNGTDFPLAAFFASILPEMSSEQRRAFLNHASKHFALRQENRAEKFFTVLQATSDLPEVKEALEKLKDRKQPDAFWRAVRIAYLRDAVARARGTAPEMVALLDEFPGHEAQVFWSIPQWSAVQNKELMKRLVAFTERAVAGKEPSHIPLEWLSHGYFNVPTKDGSEDRTNSVISTVAPLLVPHLAGLLKKTPTFQSSNILPGRVAYFLSEWAKGDEKRGQMIMEQLAKVIFDRPFMEAQNLEDKEHRANESRAREERLSSMALLVGATKGGERYLESHQEMVSWIIQNITKNDTSIALGLPPRVIVRDLQSRLPDTETIRKSGKVPPWVASLAGVDPESLPKMLAYARVAPDRPLIQSLRQLVFLYPDRLTHAQKREIDELVFVQEKSEQKREQSR